VESLPIIWQGAVVGRLTDFACETVDFIHTDLPWETRPSETRAAPASYSKYSGDLVPAEGPLAEEFRRRLDAYESLQVNMGGGDRACEAYKRPDGRVGLSCRG
jgi:hypothetical protein